MYEPSSVEQGTFSYITVKDMHISRLKRGSDRVIVQPHIDKHIYDEYIKTL